MKLALFRARPWSWAPRRRFGPRHRSPPAPSSPSTSRAPPPHYNRAQLAVGQERPRGRPRRFPRGRLNWIPDDPDALINIGVELGYLKAGRRGAEGLRRGPGSCDPSNVAAKVNKAIRLRRPRGLRLPRSKPIASALRDAPKRADLRGLAKTTPGQAGQDDAAKHARDQALKLDEKNVDAWRSARRAATSANRLRDLIADYGRAAALDLRGRRPAGRLFRCGPRQPTRRGHGRSRRGGEAWPPSRRSSSTIAAWPAPGPSATPPPCADDADQAIAVELEGRADYDNADVFIDQDR